MKKKHDRISYVKSALRIGGYLTLAGGVQSRSALLIGVVILVLAELLAVINNIIKGDK